MKRYFILLLLALSAACKKEDVRPSEDATTTIANAETVKPTVSFTFPHNNDVVQNTVLIQVAATDASGIKQVVLKIDGDKKATDKVAPYEFVWDTKQFVNNFHKLTAKATDIFGNAKTVNITVLVQNETSVQPVEQQLIDLINAERSTRSLNQLAFNINLYSAARLHSLDMKTNNFLGHTGSDGTTLGDRLDIFGYKWISAGENIRGSLLPEDGQDVFDAWMLNSGQRAIMLDPSFTEIGVSEVDGDASNTFLQYWTAVFAKPQF